MKNILATRTGHIDLFDPRQEDIRIDDIAHALSNICRWAGNCSEFYSVAQHSCIVADNLEIDYALSGLLHDASEAYISDIPTPVKRLFPDLTKLENGILTVIGLKYGANKILSGKVKAMDAAVTATEFRDLMKKDPKKYAMAFPLDTEIKPWSPREARKAFLSRFHDLNVCKSYSANLRTHIG